MQANVDKCLAFCQTLVVANRKFTFTLTIDKDTLSFSTYDQPCKGSACKGGDLKKAAPRQQRRRARRAADPAVQQKAAAHAVKAAGEKAAAEKAAAEKAAAEKAAAEKTAEEADAAAEEAAAAAAGAGPAGEAARPGPKCSVCHLPTKGHTTGRAGKDCTALPRLEMMRGSSHAMEKQVSPVKGDQDREEEPVTPDRKLLCLCCRKSYCGPNNQNWGRCRVFWADPDRY